MRIYGDNVIDDSTLTASSTKAGYSLDNLKIAQLRRRFSFDGNSGDIVITFDNIESVKHCIIDISNMSSSATVTLQANASDVWTSPSYTHAMTYAESCFYLDLSQTYKYFRLVIEDTTKTTVEFGYISIGDSYTQMPPIDPNAEIFYNTTAVNTMSIGGQVYGDDGFEYMDTTFNFPMIEETATTFNGVTIATRKQIKDLYNKLRNVTPIWVFLWPSSLSEFPPVFCIFNQEKISFKKKEEGKVYSSALALREVL